MDHPPDGAPHLLRVDLQRSLRYSGVHPEDLSPFQRILLTTDGMVTEMLEAFYWERMTVVKLGQALEPIEEYDSDLEIDEGTEVLKREILLQGAETKINRLHASSVLVPDRLDEKMREGLLNSRRPIGLLILEDRLETFREILECGISPAGPIDTHFGVSPETPVVFRTYRVFAARRPVMRITETFPPGTGDPASSR